MRIDVKGTIISDDIAWIYDLFGESYTSPAKIHEALNEANGEDVDIDINSYGGDVFAGSEIYSAIRAYQGSVKIHVVGLAASAASVIACAAKSDISPTAQIMVHNVSTFAAGDHNEMDKTSRMLKQANRAIAAAYVDKSGMSESDALQMMDVETWLTAEDAVGYGLIDEISQSHNAGTAGGTTDLNLVASAYGMLPASVINKMQERRQSLIEYFT